MHDYFTERFNRKYTKGKYIISYFLWVTKMFKQLKSKLRKMLSLKGERYLKNLKRKPILKWEFWRLYKSTWYFFNL